MLRSRAAATRLGVMCRTLSVGANGGGGGGGGVLSEEHVGEIRVPVPWGHIAGRWWGRRDVTPLLAVHGLECNAASFDRLAPLLRTEALLAVDLPGHGLSSPYPLGRPYYVMDDVMALRRVQLHYGWGEMSLVAHSYGSLVAFTFAALLPEATSRLVSFDCVRTISHLDGEEHFQHMATVARRLLAVEAKMASGEQPAYTARAMEAAFVEGAEGALTAVGAAVLTRRGRERVVPAPGDRATSELTSEPTFRFRRDPRVRFRPLGKPPLDSVLLMAGATRCHHLSIRATHSVMRSPEQRELYQRTLQLMRKDDLVIRDVEVEGLHYLHLNEPESVAPLVNDFLRQTAF